MALIGEMKYLTIGDATYEISSSGEQTTSGVTSLSTSAGSYSAVSGGTGAVTVNIPTKTSDLTNDSGFITNADVPEGASAYTGGISSVTNGSTSSGTNNGFARGDHVHNIASGAITGALGFTPATNTHTHGDITNGGDITATAPTIASGDKLIINDQSASKITNGPSFGTSTSCYLRNDGTWAIPSGTNTYTGTITRVKTSAGSHSVLDTSTGAACFNIPTKTSHLTNDSGFLTSQSYTGTVTSVGSGTGLTGGPITSSGSLSLATVHTTAPGTKGDTTNQTPTFGGTFKVTSGTVDAYGRTTTFADHTVTIPNTAATTGAAGLMSASDKIALNNASTFSTNSAAAGITVNDIVNWDSKTSNVGTITQVKTSAGSHTTITTSNGTATFNVPTKTSHLTNDSGFLTSQTYTGTITGNGTSGYLTKWNSSSGITNGPQLGSSTITYLRNDGTWQTPSFTLSTTSGGSGSTSAGFYLTGLGYLTSPIMLRGTGGVSISESNLNDDAIYISVTPPSVTIATTSQAVSSASQSLASGTDETLLNKLRIVSPINGFAIITGGAHFISNATKSRYGSIKVYSSITPGSSTYTTVAQGTVLAASGAVTRVPLAGIAAVTTSSTIGITAWQNSGSALGAGGELRVMFIENVATDGNLLGYGT